MPKGLKGYLHFRLPFTPYALPEGASAYCTFRCWNGFQREKRGLPLWGNNKAAGGILPFALFVLLAKPMSFQLSSQYMPPFVCGPSGVI